MGCFNHTSSFSGVPISYGDRIVVILGLKDLNRDNGYWTPGNNFVPISVPIRGKYNDYGGIEDVDRTPAIDVLERLFNMSVESIVECAERIQCDCADQIDYNTIHTTVNKIKSKSYIGDDYDCVFELTYIMEHESMFDYLMSEYNKSMCDHLFWRIPQEYIEMLGYKKTKKGMDNYYPIFEWKHDTLPTLIESCYIWLENEKDDYSKVHSTLRDLCKHIGCEVPDSCKKSFFEYEFEKCIKHINSKSYNKSKLEYSFINHQESGLFDSHEGLIFADYILAQFEDEKEMLQEKYKKEVCEIATLIYALKKLQKTWTPTMYHSQDIDYKQNIKFLEKALEIAKEKDKDNE